MKRIDCLKTLVPFIKDQLIIVSIGKTAMEWAALCPRDGNLYNASLGHHIPVGLGLATALPHRQVIVLDTDGSVLMLLSALTSLGSHPAGNLKIFVFDNEAYEGTGGHPSATAAGVDIAAIAQGAGVPGAKTARDVASFETAAREALTTEGLAFIVAKIELDTGPRVGKMAGHGENLIHFVRYVESTEGKTIFHNAYA